MTDEFGIKSDLTEDGDNIAVDKTENETIEPKETKQRSVSFNRDVHVKRFGKPREPRATSESPSVRKEPFTNLSKQELIDEANKVLAQAGSITCTADNPPEKFFSLPHRRKFKEDKSGRRNSDDAGSTEGKEKTPLGRSTSDVTPKKRKERTSLSTLFRRAQRNKSPDSPVVVTTKPVVNVKRSKSDVSDLKSSTNLNTQPKPIRKRSGSESEEFLKSLRNKKAQLSPIIESSPREDYFKKTSPLDIHLHQKQYLIANPETNKLNNLIDDSKEVNPIEKPPRYKIEKLDPKPPVRIKKLRKEKSPPITETPKRKTDSKKTLLVDEIDSFKGKEIKDRIKSSIKKIEDNIYGNKDMIHSSQKPPDKPPLTRGHTVDHMVKILKEDHLSPPPKAHLIAPSNGTNVNQPFSYTRPSVSPDPNLFIRNTSPERPITPVNTMSDKGVVYAHVVRENGGNKVNNFKQTIHKTYSPSRDKFSNMSDEDEGLGCEDRHKLSPTSNYDYKTENDNYNSLSNYKITDSPIKPKFREYKLTSFKDLEPTYANEYPYKQDISRDYIDTFRGRADGMDTKRKLETENKPDLDFNELSHRRQLLESRLNSRSFDRDKIDINAPISRYLTEIDPIYEAEKRMIATEKYVNETARYYRQTVEQNRFSEGGEDYKYDVNNKNLIHYDTESRAFKNNIINETQDEIDRREFIDSLEPKVSYKKENLTNFPPEPEYEPPSLEFNAGKPVLSPDEYTEKKYKVKKYFTSSHDVLQTGQKYKKDDRFGKRKGHYASNPEISHEREEEYANLPSNPSDSYHNSLRRTKNKDRRYEDRYNMRRHDSSDSRDYYRDRSPRRYDVDNRLVDSGIENDFRKDSSGEIHRSKQRRYESDDDARDTSLFLVNERRHTEDNYPSEQIYANGEYLATFKDFDRENTRSKRVSRERSYDNDSNLDPKLNKNNKISAKPPKAKKISGLERVKQLFSRDSSKKSKKEKEIVQPKTRTRVLKSPEHLGGEDSEYKRYTDPEPSDMDIRKREIDLKREEKRHRISKEDLIRHRGSKEKLHRESDSRDSDAERRYKETEFEYRYDGTLKGERRYKERKEEKRQYNSSDRDSDHHSRPSDGESEWTKSRLKNVHPLDSPALAERNRGRRRLATPSPTPSPPRRHPTVPPASSGGWFKSLDRLTWRKGKNSKVDKESIITTEDESTRKGWTKKTNSPAKNLRFFGDTDQESDTRPSSGPKPRSHPILRKTISNSSTGLDEIDHSFLSNKSYSLSNLHREDKTDSPPRTKQYHKRNLHNISEIHSNSETESHLKIKPPINPYDRRSRSHSSSKTLKGSKGDLRRYGRSEDRGSSSELRSSKLELKHRRRTPAPNSGESSTEGDSSQQSQRSVVYLHATTVGDIPNPNQLNRNRSRDDVSSVNSSNFQVRSTTKSFSIFAPWTPKHYNDQHDVHYAQRPNKIKHKEFKKSSSTKNLSDDRPAVLNKKSYSQTTLNRRPQNSRLTSSSTTLYRKSDKRNSKENLTTQSTLSRRSEGKEKKIQSNEVLNRDSDRERISRSISMPKDGNKKAGWFKLSSKNKKPDINTRVR